MAFFALDSQPGAMSADLYEPPYVIGVEAGSLESLELALNIKMLECKGTGRVLAVSEIRAWGTDAGGAWYHATIIWCRKRQIEAGIPLDQDEAWDEQPIDDEPPPNYGSHPGAVIREYETSEGPF